MQMCRPWLCLHKDPKKLGFLQGGVAGMTQRQRDLGMPAHPHVHKEGRPILMTHTAVSGLTLITSSLAETGRERRPPVLAAGGASLDLMCETSKSRSAPVCSSWQLLEC